MKKTGSNVISFPKLRRSEQNGLTQRSFPARWLGLLVMTTVGAAWAISPGSEGEAIPASVHNVSSVVFEGEPQVVAQLMGAVVGQDGVPQGELKALSSFGASNKRVVVAPTGEQAAPSPYAKADFLAGVERLEQEVAKNGTYPAIPSAEAGLQKAGYRTSGESFTLQSGEYSYDSNTGVGVVKKGEPSEEGPLFKVCGHLEGYTTGWGPWKSDKQKFQTSQGGKLAQLDWLETAPVTPSWSARMYFPIDRETTGYAFRRGDGTSAYHSGELLYDAVSGTFQMKLYRTTAAAGRPLDSDKLETELGHTDSGCEFVGDSELLSDLGFLPQPGKEAPVVGVSTPIRLSLSAHDALDGLALSTLSRHQKVLPGGDFLATPESSSAASVVGRLNLEDKLGQVHEVRMRAGRATDYDWVVGQLCPVSEEIAVSQSEAYENVLERETKSSVIAGK